MDDRDCWQELTERLSIAEAQYREMAEQAFSDSHDPVNAFRWQQRAEGIKIARGYMKSISQEAKP
jgi:hypothetical protein